MIFRYWRCIYLASALSVGDATGAAGQAFDTQPLRTPIAFPGDSLPRSWPASKVWLEATPRPAPPASSPAVREHLFAIISAAVKTRVSAGKPPFPPQGDSALAELFEWGDRLDVPGAGLVAKRLRGPVGTSSSPATTPGFTIEFDSLYTLVAEADGWAVRFPHYFMIGTARRQTLANDIETTLVVLSTLFARDTTNRPGASQATVLIVSAPTRSAELTAFWLHRLGLAASDTVAAPARAVRAYRGRDADIWMNREVIVFTPPGGTILFIYTGINGTFEANRPHFLDLINTLRVRPAS